MLYRIDFELNIPNGNLTDITNAREYITSNDYNPLNNPTATTDAETDRPLHLRVTSVTDANGNTTSYTYNGFGDLTQLTSSESRRSPTTAAETS